MKQVRNLFVAMVVAISAFSCDKEMLYCATPDDSEMGGIRVTVRQYTPAGKLLENAKVDVAVSDAEGTTGQYLFTVQTDLTGMAIIDVMPGTYHLNASYTDENGNEFTSERSEVIENQSGSTQANGPVRVDVEEGDPINLTLIVDHGNSK